MCKLSTFHPISPLSLPFLYITLQKIMGHLQTITTLHYIDHYNLCAVNKHC